MHRASSDASSGNPTRPSRSRTIWTPGAKPRGGSTPPKKKKTHRRRLQFPGLPPEVSPKHLMPEEIAFVLEEMWQREKRGWSMEEVAALSGVKRQEIGQIERWQHGLYYSTAIRIAAAFGMTIEAYTKAAHKHWLPLGKKKWGGIGGKK